MHRYITLLVVPFVLSAVLAAQPPKGGGGKPVDPPGKGQPPTTGPGNKPENPGPPATPPGAEKAAEAPNPKAKEPVAVPVTITPTAVTPPGPLPEGTAQPVPDATVVKPGDCPKGQTCPPLTTPPTDVVNPTTVTAASANQYAQRFALSADTWFVGRVTLAAMLVAGEVLMEPETTPEHEARMRYVGAIMRNPDEGGRRLARLVVVALPISIDKAGLISTPATDQQMVMFLRQRWTALAKSMGQLY